MMGRLGSLRVAVPGAVVLAVVVVFLIAWATQPGTVPAAVAGTQSVAVTSITRSCPPAATGSPGQQISAVAVPSESGPAAKSGATTVPGSATFTSVGTGPAKSASGTAQKSPVQTPDVVSAPGRPATVDTVGDAVGVAATGEMAAGFEAEQSDAAGTGLISCTHPGSDMWFVGTGTSAGAARVWLYLVNTGNVAASVDVTILTDTGEQNGLSNAITVGSGEYVKENVTPDVSGSQAVALHVQTAVGQVSAAVWESGGSGGGAWLPQASAPSTAQVIPGLTVASSSARLFVVVPGSSDVQLKIVAYTSAGAVGQFPGTPVDASAGAATPVTLSSLGASAAGLELTSNVPVVASVLVPGTGMGAFTTSESALTEQGVVAGNPVTRGTTVGVLLTAPSTAATVGISEISADGTVTTPAGDQSVLVAAAHTVAVTVARPPGARQSFAIVITPSKGSGPVYAARVVTAGTGGITAPLTALLPVSSALTSIILPAARNSYTAVLP
jgi:hypothetical protein